MSRSTTILQEILDLFDAAYVINLRSRPDRRREVVRQFRRFGIEIPNDKVRILTTERPVEAGHFSSPGRRGCFMSHLRVLRDAQERGFDRILVFEDDLQFIGRSLETAGDIPDFLRGSEWDIVHLGYSLPQIHTTEQSLADWGRLIPWRSYVQGAQFFGIRGAAIGALADYMSACAGRPRDHEEGGATFRDVAATRFRAERPEIRTFLHVPSLARQSGLRSELHEHGLFDRCLPTRAVKDLLRQARARLRER